MTLCFRENFDRSLIENWAIDRGWQIERIKERNLLVGKGHSWLTLKIGEEWTNYSFRCRFKLSEGTLHLNYRMSEEGRYFVGARKNELYLKKEAPWGKFIDLAREDLNFDLEVWYNFKIEGDGGKLRIYIDDKLRIEYVDETPLASGSIALESLGQSIVQISNIEVELTAGKAFPDLILALWNKPNSSIKWISPYPALSNTITTLSALIKNVGIVPVDKSFDTELYIDGMLKKTWRFNPISEGEDIHHANNPLIPGKSFPISYSDTFLPGNHSFKWVVDSKNEVQESDESQQSNTLEATVNFLTESDLPDLIVDAIFPQEDLVFGQDITWKVRIKNIGTNAVNIPFFISLKNADGVQFGAFWLDYLGAGNTATFSTKQFASIAGTERLTAAVDVGNVVLEKDETNNMLTKNFTINKVDLEVKDLDIKPNDPDVSQDLIITFTIKNNGPGDITKPFKIKVYPGAVNSGLTQPTEIEFPANKLPLKSTNSVTMQHKFTPSYPGKYHVVVTADSTFVYKEENTQNNTATATIQLAGMINGRLIDPDPNYPSVTIDKLEWYINKDPTISWFRKKVAYQALYEAKVGLCGQDAKDRYGASGKWCSEFASWLYLKVGMKNIKYCSAYFLFCWNYCHLDEVTLNSELVKLFDRNGNRFKWRTRNQVTPQTAEVGDYLSLKTNGKKKNHAAIIVAVSQDNNYLWTVEGNCGDCVRLQRKNYFKDGNINEDIDGIGKIDAGLF